LPGSELKVFKKKMEGETTITLAYEGKATGLKAENFYKMMFDMAAIEKAEPKPKRFELVETISDNIDIVYAEVALPFPMSNRDFVQKRFHAGSKDDAVLLKKLGFYDFNHDYYVIMIKSIEHEKFPEKSSPVRAELKLNHWLIEEVPGEKDTFTFRTAVCQTLNGSVPLFFVNDLGPKMAHKMMGAMVDNYYKVYGKN